MNTGVLGRYRAHLQASGASPKTIALRTLHAREITALAALPDLTIYDLETWMQPPGRVRFAAETLKSRRASARRFVSWLHDTGMIASNPSSALRPVRVPEAPPRVIPDDSMRAVLDGYLSPRDRAAILLARYACLRLSEIAGLRTTDRQGDALRLTGKGGRVRVVYLNAELYDALTALERTLTGPGWYFPGIGAHGHIHPQALHKIMKRLTGWNPHALRHAGATAAYRATKDLESVRLMLGHSTLTTTQRYLAPDEVGLRAVASATLLAA